MTRKTLATPHPRSDSHGSGCRQHRNCCCPPMLRPKTMLSSRRVSQGGMYEVELGKVAEQQGSAQDIKDQGNTEAHDHELVGNALKEAAGTAGITFPAELNTEFKTRLAKISALSERAVR